MKLTHVLYGLAALALAVSHGTARSDTWNLATAYSDATFHTENIRWFAKEVEKATKGALKIEVHSGASMFKMGEMKRALRTGQVPMAEFIVSAYGNEDPIYEADSIPFLATGEKEAFKLYELQKPLLAKRYEKEGIVPLYSVIWPGNGLYAATAVNKVADMRGMKIRGQTPIVARLGELVGAIPVNIQLVEVPQAFSTGVVTSMFSAASNGVDMQTWDYVRYFYDLRGFSPRNVVAVNARAWKRLPEDVRQAVLETAARAEKRGWDIAVGLQDSATKTLAQHGTSVPEITPELLSGFQEVGQRMVQEWIKRAGAEGEALARGMGKLN